MSDPAAARAPGGAGFGFAFDPAFRALALPFGIRPSTALVVVDDSTLRVRFGPWRLESELDNIVDVRVDGPYRWWRVIGPLRMSIADRGVTFATNARRGVCLCFDRPVRGVLPGGRPRHPNLTVTVADCDGLAERLTSARAA